MEIYNSKEYDETNPKSIEDYAKKLIGTTFSDVKRDYINKTTNFQDELASAQEDNNKKHKGKLGEIIEENFFYYKCNNDSKPDFDKAGVELKVTPYKINKNGSKSAKERLILTMIDYMNVVHEKFETSHMWKKASLILLIYYLYQKEINNRLDYRIDYVNLFSPPKQDIDIIRHDFEVIIEKIKCGKAHELSEADTLYLGAAPKASTSKDRRKQPFNSEMAKPRAFAFKNSYMTYVLNNYIILGKDTYEPIIKQDIEVSFEDYVVGKVDKYNGYSIDELCNEFNLNFAKKPKNLEAILAYRILGIKGNKAEEFEKANIVVKAIRLEENNKIKQNMSFPSFKFKELIEEEWEDSTFGCYLSETRFLFIVYKFDKNKKLVLKGCQFWNVPYKDLEDNVKVVWEKTKSTIIEGVKIEKKNGKNTNNFPKSSENPVCHVRPHAINASDTYELPNGEEYTKQCFWLKNTYILSQLDKRFLD